MKIILAQATNMQRAGKWGEQKTYRPILNIARIGAYIIERGYNVKLFDFDRHTVPTIKEIAEEIMNEDPDVIGFSCITPRFPETLNIFRECKKLNKKVITVVGGYHVNGNPNCVFNNEEIDYGVLGEGEFAFAEFLDCIDRKISPIHVLNIISKEYGINAIRPKI